MQYNFNFVVCASIITCVTMSYYFLGPRLNDARGNVFAAIGCHLLLCCALAAADMMIDGSAHETALRAVNTVYLLLLNLLPCLIIIYIIIITEKTKSLASRYYCLIFLPFAAESCLLLVSAGSGMVFSISEGSVIPGPLAFVGYAAAAGYVAAGAVIGLLRRKRMTARKFTAIAVSAVIGLAAIAAQYVSRAPLAEFASSLSLLIMFIVMLPYDEVSDPVTGAFSMSAISSLAGRSLSRNEHFVVFGCAVEGLRRINDIYGESSANEFLKFIVKSLEGALGGKAARVYGGEFCVITYAFGSAQEAMNASGALPCVWRTGDCAINFTALRIVIDSAVISAPGEIQELMDFAIRHARTVPGVSELIVDGRLRERYYRREQVRRAVVEAIHTKSVNVVYQPIVRAADGKIEAAEALARITDFQLGELPPAEFIPIAEQSGLILDLGRCVREKVWRFVSEYDIRGAGVNHICVNLSALECTQRAVMEEILEEKRLAGAEGGLVNLEVTETAAVSSVEVLAENMEMMREYGFAFHLDDYGTGYSGMSNLISLPFDAVKIDHSIVTMAEDERCGKFVRRMILPFHGYGMTVVCEGIETAEQAKMVQSWGVDYIQGYLYSKPLTQQSFIEYAGIEKNTERQTAEAQV